MVISSGGGEKVANGVNMTVPYQGGVNQQLMLTTTTTASLPVPTEKTPRTSTSFNIDTRRRKPLFQAFYKRGHSNARTRSRANEQSGLRHSADATTTPSARESATTLLPTSNESQKALAGSASAMALGPSFNVAADREVVPTPRSTDNNNSNGSSDNSNNPNVSDRKKHRMNIVRTLAAKLGIGRGSAGGAGNNQALRRAPPSGTARLKRQTRDATAATGSSSKATPTSAAIAAASSVLLHQSSASIVGTDLFCNKSELAPDLTDLQKGATKRKIAMVSPRLELLDDRAWHVENQHSTKAPLEIPSPAMKHNIFVRDCSQVTLTIGKKFNSLTLENCKDVSVVVNSCISSIELIHCAKCKLQILDTASAVSIDNSQGIEIYASYKSREIQLTTSLVNEINFHIPSSAESTDDWVELPVPCQYMHRLAPDSNTLQTRVSDLYG